MMTKEERDLVATLARRQPTDAALVAAVWAYLLGATLAGTAVLYWLFARLFFH